MHLVYFYKTDCVPCAEKKPLALEIAEAADLALGFVNTDEPSNAEVVATNKIKAVPTLCVFEDEKRIVGFYGKLITKDAILRFLGRHES